jgi:hypothetical protein
MRTERARFAAFFGGILLWLCYPLAFWNGIHARWLGRCEHRIYGGHFDDCYSDYLPIAEMFWCLLAWLLTIVFFRLARTFWAPDRRPDSVAWLRRRDPTYYAPIPFGLAMGGIGWTGWNFLSLPFQTRFALLLSYWAIFCLWFGAAAIANWKYPRQYIGKPE